MRALLGRSLRVIVVLLVTIAAPRAALAECIRSPEWQTVCKELAESSLVFDAEVLGVELQQGTGVQLVSFQILRTFKGGKQDRWSGAFSFTAEDHHFKPGTRVLVYATGRGGSWSTACNRTMAYAESERDALAKETAGIIRCRPRTK